MRLEDKFYEKIGTDCLLRIRAKDGKDDGKIPALNIAFGYAQEQLISAFNSLPGKYWASWRRGASLRDLNPPQLPQRNLNRFVTGGFLLGISQDLVTLAGAAAYVCGYENPFTEIAAGITITKITTNIGSQVIYRAYQAYLGH